MAVIIYLLEGSLGLPVFAQAKFGFIHLFGPTGGYLAGFLPAAFLSGFLAERSWDRTIAGAVLVFSLGTLTIFGCGLAWLSRFTPPESLLEMGLWPFMPGAVIKIITAALFVPIVRQFLSTRQP